MKILALDFGVKHVGLAISNTKGTLALPYAIIANTGSLLSKLKTIVREEAIDKIIIGVPFYKPTSPLYLTIQTFISKLKKNTHLQVDPVDELMTSSDAKRRTKQNNRHDVAAMLILEQYLATLTQ